MLGAGLPWIARPAGAKMQYQPCTSLRCAKLSRSSSCFLYCTLPYDVSAGRLYHCRSDGLSYLMAQLSLDSKRLFYYHASY